MSGRDRERERRAAASVRTNEYFVPKDGIDREVITADICRYLGNDALVRPGQYENPQTRQLQHGYYITAYRNLTTAMIADLKADSERWDQERRATASQRGQPANVGYRDSAIHQSRQYYGPTEQVPVATSGYQSSSIPGVQQGVYDSGSQYQQQQSYVQPAVGGYSQPPGGYAVPETSYYVGGNMEVDQPRGTSRDPRVIPQSQSQAATPRVNPYSSSTPTYQQQQDGRSQVYYSSPPGPATTTSYAAQPADPYYGRGPSVYDSQEAYDHRAYQDPSGYSQAPLVSAQNLPATSNSSSRREREREPDSRDRHHRNNPRR